MQAPNAPHSPDHAAAAGTLPFAPLGHLGVIRVQGTDAPAFLQGQLTNDVLTLSGDEARLAGYLTPNGRMLATFWVIRHDQSPEPEQAEEPVFWLVCSRDIAASIAKRLGIYVLRAKVKVLDISESYRVLGFVGLPDRAPLTLNRAPQPAIKATLPEVALTETTVDMLTTPARRLLGPGHQLLRSLLLIPNESLEAVAGAHPNFRLSDSDWLQLDVASGTPSIVADTQERFIPQMLNLDLIGGVSFRKGCYPGQEVVARSEYRGKVKRRMYAGICSGPLPAPGTDIIAWDGTAVGQVICCASLSATPDAELTDIISQGSDNPDAPLPITVVGRRYLLLFEARIEVIGSQPQGAGMIATSLRIGEAAIGLLRLPYDLPVT